MVEQPPAFAHEKNAGLGAGLEFAHEALGLVAGDAEIGDPGATGFH